MGDRLIRYPAMALGQVQGLLKVFQGQGEPPPLSGHLRLQ